ncbi:MAG TPA: lipoyl domain-containing protein [Haliangiales bacterium]|nr:lipoyl domain-containing protein [Haliangiales bacterium]
MRTPVLLPQIGESMPVLRVTGWFKRAGDRVVEGEPLYSVSTDKMDFDLPAPASGVLADVSAAAGDVLPVGAVVAFIES